MKEVVLETVLRITKLVGTNHGDMMALEAKYHLSCLSQLYRKYTSTQGDSGSSQETQISQGLAFAELVQYIEECRHAQALPVFKLTELTKLYLHRLVHWCNWVWKLTAVSIALAYKQGSCPILIS